MRSRFLAALSFAVVFSSLGISQSLSQDVRQLPLNDEGKRVQTLLGEIDPLPEDESEGSRSYTAELAFHELVLDGVQYGENRRVSITCTDETWRQVAFSYHFEKGKEHSHISVRVTDTADPSSRDFQVFSFSGGPGRKPSNIIVDIVCARIASDTPNYAVTHGSSGKFNFRKWNKNIPDHKGPVRLVCAGDASLFLGYNLSTIPGDNGIQHYVGLLRGGMFSDKINEWHIERINNYNVHKPVSAEFLYLCGHKL